MSLVLNLPKIWIYQGSAYTSGFEYARIVNIPEFWICQGYTGLRICLNNSWICLIMSGYVWICLNMLKYAWIYLNLLNGFCFTFTHLFYNTLSTWTRSYLFERLQETRGYSLKEHDSAFLKRQHLIFFFSRWKYLICFFFSDKIFLKVRFKFAVTFWG